MYYNVASSQLPAPQIALCTKVVLQSRQFSSSSSADTPRTKVALQSRQFSASSSTDAVPATKSAHGGYKVLCLARNLHMEGHKVQCLPRDLRTEVHKVLRLPRNLRMKVHKVLRLQRNLHIKRRCPADARAYIRPLGKQQAPHTARKCCAGAQPTPGRTSDPLASSKRRTQCTWRFTKCCACHEICARRFTKYSACHEICT